MKADKVQLKLEKHHPELLNVWENLRKEVGVITPKKAPQPAHIAMKLLPFQLEGLDWMQRQEAGPWRGGMRTLHWLKLAFERVDGRFLAVADEMGMASLHC